MAKMDRPIITPRRLPTIYRHPLHSLSSLPLTAPFLGTTKPRRVIHQHFRPFIFVLTSTPKKLVLPTTSICQFGGRGGDTYRGRAIQNMRNTYIVGVKHSAYVS